MLGPQSKPLLVRKDAVLPVAMGMSDPGLT
ncbi:MAG: hypothetical protein RLZZ265_4024, partial [Verrucomicrobiota bacterium]